MDNPFYNSSITCPVCNQAIEVTKIKVGSYRMLNKDTDLCFYYEGIQPLFYEIWVCEFCGYASTEDKFLDIPDVDSQVIRSKISSKWKRKSYLGERTVDNALDAFKLYLYQLQLRKASNAEVARVCMRIAWLYRMKQDPKEIDFLKFAINCYIDAFERGKFPIEKLDEALCLYLIAELNRRIGNITASAMWFGRFFNSRVARNNKKLTDLARDQYQLVKEAVHNKTIQS